MTRSYDVKKTLLSAIETSVIRRGLGLLSFTLLASILNLALAYVAASWLGADKFGIFYFAITAVNILFAPAIIMNLLFTRAVATIVAKHGPENGRRSSYQAFGFVSAWGGIATACTVAIVAVVGAVTQAFSIAVAALVLIVVYASYCAEVGRIALQGLGQFMYLGFYSLSWMLLRFVLGAGAIYLIGTVWSGLAGILLATAVLVLVFFRPRRGYTDGYLFPWRRGDEANRTFRQLVQAGAFMKLALGYSTFMLMAYADIIVAYVFFDQTTLSAYAASAVLPKGLLMLTMPVIQLAFPLIVGEGANARPTMSLIVRSFALTVFTASAGALVIALFAHPVCSGQYGFAECQDNILIWGLAASVILSVLRLAVSVAYALHLDWLPAFLLLPLLAGFAAALVYGTNTPTELVRNFVVFCGATLLVYVFTALVSRARVRAAASA